MRHIDFLINTLTGKAFKLDEVSKNECDNIWLSGSGDKIPISEMQNEYILNAIGYVQRKFNPKINILIKSENKELMSKFNQVASHTLSCVKHPKYRNLFKEARERGLLDE